MNEPEVIQALLKAKTIAVIGATDNPTKPSYYVPAYMQRLGHRVLPVNPALETALGEKTYGSLAELPEKPELVNVFRLPKYLPEIVQEMIALGLPALWVQSGILHPEAAAQAEAAGILVVMDRCMMVESQRRVAHDPA